MSAVQIFFRLIVGSEEGEASPGRTGNKKGCPGKIKADEHNTQACSHGKGIWQYQRRRGGSDSIGSIRLIYWQIQYLLILTRTSNLPPQCVTMHRKWNLMYLRRTIRRRWKYHRWSKNERGLDGNERRHCYPISWARMKMLYTDLEKVR